MNKPIESVSGNLTIRQLEVFAMASRSPTFSEAAKRLGISQPSLSNTIAKIEHQLGLSLFDRTTRTLAMTPQGERLAVVAEDLVRNFQASLSNIHQAASVSRGRMSMAVIPSVAASVTSQALNLFFKTYPDFDVALHDITGEKGLAWVLDRVVDFGIIAKPPAASELHIETVYYDDFQIICRKDSKLAKKKILSWQDIAATPIILAGHGAIRRDVETAWLQADMTIRPRFEVEQIMTAIAMVSAGMGITILPSLYRPTIRNEDLVSVPGHFHIQREIVFVRRADRALSKPVQHMMEYFRQALADFESDNSDARKPSSKSKAKKD